MLFLGQIYAQQIVAKWRPIGGKWCPFGFNIWHKRCVAVPSLKVIIRRSHLRKSYLVGLTAYSGYEGNISRSNYAKHCRQRQNPKSLKGILLYQHLIHLRGSLQKRRDKRNEWRCFSEPLLLSEICLSPFPTVSQTQPSSFLC